MPSTRADGGLPESHDYYYRRELTAAELLVPVAVGAAAGLTVFYLARLLAQRTPLIGRERQTSSPPTRAGRPIAPRRA